MSGDLPEIAERKPGDIVTIPGLAHPRVVVEQRYDYDVDPCKCPVCGSVGFIWAGWFSCDDCPCVALKHSGETFMPAPRHDR